MDAVLSLLRTQEVKMNADQNKATVDKESSNGEEHCEVGHDDINRRAEEFITKMWECIVDEDVESDDDDDDDDINERAEEFITKMKRIFSCNHGAMDDKDGGGENIDTQVERFFVATLVVDDNDKRRSLVIRQSSCPF